MIEADKIHLVVKKEWKKNEENASVRDRHKRMKDRVREESKGKCRKKERRGRNDWFGFFV